MKQMVWLLFLLLSLINFDVATAKGKSSEKMSAQSLTKFEPIITGGKFTFTSQVLNEDKEIYISLPDNYDSRNYYYPVIYVVEAEFLFNPTSMISKHMAMRNEIPQSIVIGIANGEHEKRQEMTLPIHGGKVYDHLEFLRSELIPHIEKNFRANSHRTIVGLSPTTGLVLEAFWQEPDIFSGYISLATHLTWPPRKGVSMVEQLIKTITDKEHPKASIYLGIAEQDITRTKYETAAYQNAVDKLKGVPVTNVNFKLEALEGEEHYGMALSGIRSGLKTIFPLMKPMNRFREENDPAAAIKVHYDKLSKVYGFKTLPIETSDPHSESLSGWAEALSRWNMPQKAIGLYKLGVEYFPEEPAMLMGLAESYQKSGLMEEALATAKKAVAVATKLELSTLAKYQQKVEELKL